MCSPPSQGTGTSILPNPAAISKGVVCAFLEPDKDFVRGDGRVRGSVDEVPEKVAGLGVEVALADLCCEQGVDAKERRS